MDARRRLPRRLIRHQQRASGLNAMDIMKSFVAINSATDMLMMSGAMMDDEDDDFVVQNGFILQSLSKMVQYMRINKLEGHEVPVNLNPIDPTTVRIENRAEFNFQTIYGRIANKADLHRIHNVLNLPLVMKTNNSVPFTSEYGLLLLLV
jgi:hypothetical protein